MEAESASPSVISYLSKAEPGSCGYCNRTDEFEKHSLWAHELTVNDYQDLVDRGWRRCGKYCYKAIMDKTCCPLYTIRCTATDYSLSRSQKRILKRMNHFLATGEKSSVKGNRSCTSNPGEYVGVDLRKYEQMEELTSTVEERKPALLPTKSTKEMASTVQNIFPVENNTTMKSHTKTITTPLEVNANISSMKAKHRRIKRKFEKLKALGFSEEEIAKKMVEKKRYPAKKTLEDFIDHQPENPAHRLEVRVVRSSPRSEEFVASYQDGFKLYKIYQVSIHSDSPSSVTDGSYQRFLVNSPLEGEGQFGSYHQQYWLDGVLIAVGVIDILPLCVSSVYFFYNPEYAFLSLGTYGALREIYFTRTLAKIYPNLIFYYMGFYIHTCPKMRYKAAFKPSFLLCPEVYTWHPFKMVVSKLDVNKYSRLNDDATAVANVGDFNLAEIKIVYRSRLLEIGRLKFLFEEMRQELEEYCKVVGPDCARRMVILLK